MVQPIGAKHESTLVIMTLEIKLTQVLDCFSKYCDNGILELKLNAFLAYRCRNPDSHQ